MRRSLAGAASPMGRTIGTALLAPLVVLAVLAALTSDRHSRRLAVGRWASSRPLRQVVGRGVDFMATAEPLLLRLAPPEGQPPLARLELDLILRQNLPLRLTFLSLPRGAEPRGAQGSPGAAEERAAPQ